MQQDIILVFDLGSEENPMIAREIRALGVYSEIHPHDLTTEQLEKIPNIRGIILNGGKNRVVDGVAIDASEAIYALDVPVLAVDHDAKKGEKLSAWPECECERKVLLNDFLFNKCKCEKTWNTENFIEDQIKRVRRQVGDGKVLLALSGGVDSSVVAALLIKAIGPENLTCVHVNHGLLRKGEPEQVVRVFREEMGANLIYVDAVDRFLDKLAGVAEPEKKRKIIGEEFIRVFEEEAAKLTDVKFLHNADACPVVRIVEEIARSHSVPVILLCDTNHLLSSDYSEVKVIGAGRDAVDFALINLCRKEDIVVTQDYGVAAMALGRGALAIHQSGMLYTQDNIDLLLMERHLAQKARMGKGKHHLKGPKKRTPEDDQRFRTAFEQLLSSVMPEN